MSPLPAAAADRALLERILRESGLARQASPPSLAEYAAAIQEALMDWFAGRAPSLAWLLDSRVAQAVLWLVVAAILAGLTVQLLRWRHGRPAAAPSLALRPPRKEGLPESDHAAWRREIEARLLRGDVAGALEAVWWWLARSLCGPAADASWTSRELVAQARRGDLRSLTNALDRMAYGERAPSAAEVRGLLARFEESLA